MATSRHGSGGDPKKETILELAVAVLIAVSVIFGLLWFLSSHKIVYYSTPLLRWLGSPWYFFNPGRWEGINEAYVVFRNSPRAIPLSNYLSFSNACLLPLAILIAAGSVLHVMLRFTSKAGGGDMRRRLEPMEAAREIAKTFPAILPVLHLGPDLVADKLPLWRRQTFPEDIWQKEKVHGRPLSAGNHLFPDRVETYFRGGEVKDGPHQLRNDRRWSKMLGYQVVDLIADSAKNDSICFPDRFSPQGKVLFGILCAHAFGGREGKADYQKACDQLNKTCAGQANGLPNLTVAQWIYSKYRMNEDARKLFAVHHWEFVYLFGLFLKAKRSGKATHTDWIWLKPLDRVMFYALNTVGRAVAHTEAGSVFAMWDYEMKCARFQQLPLRFRADGTMEHHICIHTAVEGMSSEFARYQAGTDDDENWWKELSTWDAAKKMAAQQAAMKAELQAQAKSTQLISTMPAQPDTAFDTEMNAKRAEEDAAREKEMIKALTGGAEMF